MPINIGEQLDCLQILEDNRDDPQIQVTANVLNLVSNNLQPLVDCLPDGGSLILNVSDMNPEERVVVSRPITIRPFRGPSRNGTNSQRVDVKCPPGGFLEIRYEAIYLLCTWKCHCVLK